MKNDKMIFKDSIKDFLKKFLFVTYVENGKFYLNIKIPIRFDARIIYRLFYASRHIIKNKVVFDNYMGKGYGCNPKYVANKLLELYPNKFDIVWIVSEKDRNDTEYPKGIRIVNYGSIQSKIEYATSKVWISNYHKISYLKKGMYKKKNQVFIQMWHGSLGIKKIENDVPILTTNISWLNLAKMSSQMVDYWISNSNFESNIYKRAFWNVRNILEYGHPRNDILFIDNINVKNKVKKYFNIINKKIVFYAPTFREDYRLECYKINFQLLTETLSNRFGGEWCVIVRLHPRVRKFSKEVLGGSNNVYDGTYYSDIQELIASSDIMITDYSSCIFDFLLTKRPAFIFATDVEEFNNERGFYYPLEKTPFLIAKNNDELVYNILAFNNEVYKSKVNLFLKDKGCIEDGSASERVAKLINSIIDEEMIKN